MATTKRRVPDQKAWARAIAEAWLNDDFKDLLQTNPVAAFNKLGFDVNAAFDLPPRPSTLTEEILKPVASGEARLPETAPLTTIPTAEAYLTTISPDGSLLTTITYDPPDKDK